ncbi:MAG TPA: type II toxin-antitoxin system RelE/ParE family toxin [Longimicrobium sp.]|jgi:phage-related protein
MRSGEKPVAFEGSSLEDISAFPPKARRQAGYELHQVALGEDPSDWKPIATVGSGAREIRIKTDDGNGRLEHRVIYVAKFDDAVYVLHAFRKTTPQTSRHDIERARKHYTELMNEQRARKRQP